MPDVVFVAPYFGATMARACLAIARQPGVRLGVVTHQPEEKLPSALRGLIAGHYRVRDALDAAQLTEAVTAFVREWGRVDRLLGYLEQLQEPLAQVRSALGIAGMNAHVAAGFRNKNEMKARLQAAGLPVARQALVTDAASAEAFAERAGFPLVLKPVAGVGTRDTLRVRSREELYGALNRLLPSPSRPVQAEEFVQGSEHTLEAISVGGTVLWQSSSYYLPGPLAVLENPWMQYCVLLPREQHPPHVRDFLATNRAALKALGMGTGLSHMEWFLTKRGPVISEVGARPPGVHLMPMMGRAHGVDMWQLWARLMVHGQWSIGPRQKAVGCAFLRGQGRGNTVRSLHGVEQAFARVGSAVVARQLPRPGQPRSSHYEGEGWVIVEHERTEGVVDALRTLVMGIRVELG